MEGVGPFSSETEEYGPFSSALAILFAFVCTSLAVGLTLRHIYMHLKNYTEPTYQRYIIRIIFMVPVYAAMSFMALVYSDAAMYFNTIRDVYEAWVIYNFLSLCLAWVGGPGAVVVSLHGRMLKPSYLLGTCCFPAIPLDGRFIRRCKQGCLQFVFLKPILAATCLLLYRFGLYEDGDFSFTQGYPYVTVIYMTSYSVAIYALILFYVGCKDLLRSFSPVPKFLMIKAVVFLTYWQGVFMFMIAKTGAVRSPEEAADLQNLIICAEMALGALGFMHAFPYKPFMEANVGETAGLTSSLKHAITLHDVVDDTVHQFAPTYYEYVLYSGGGEEAPPNRYRTRTFVPTGREMDALRKHKMGPHGSTEPSPRSPASPTVDEFTLVSPPSFSLSSPGSGTPQSFRLPGSSEQKGKDNQSSPTSALGRGSPAAVRLAFSPVLGSSSPGDAVLSAGGQASGGRIGDADSILNIEVDAPQTLGEQQVRAQSEQLRDVGEDVGETAARRSSSARVSGSASSVDSSRRSSEAEAATEQSRLTRVKNKGGKGGHDHFDGLLMDEEDVLAEDDCNLEGHVER